MSSPASYWDKEWRTQTAGEYQPYLEGHMRAYPWFLEAFREKEVKHVCDAACGFGAYGAMLAANGFQVSGFDISSNAVELTTQLFTNNNLRFSDYVVSDICAIDFAHGFFDATVAHAVLDHLTKSDAERALSELMRITKPGGLVFISFDPLEQDDISEPHDVLEDGSFLYRDGARSGLLFRYYAAQSIKNILQPYQIFQWRINKRGEREILLQR